MATSEGSTSQPSAKSSAKPVLIYDGRCGFCKLWIHYWQSLTLDRIDYQPSQKVASRYPQIEPEAFRESVQYVRPDGTVASGARAVFETLNLLWLYPALAILAEPLYKLVARNRDSFYQFTRFTFGTSIEPTRFAATQWLFVRALALIYAVAFGSLAMQVEGLIGSRGILPATQFLSGLAAQAGAIRFLAVPSIFWLASDDITLIGAAVGGILFSILLFVTGFIRGRFEKPLLALLFVLYLSFSAIGQDFLQFQWDSLLLEAGFLAIFLGRNRIVPWLYRWLVFRLMFLSGAVKLLSGDLTWRSLTALDFHFHTQPLPTMLAWYVDKLPPAILHFMTAGTLVIEGILPFFIFLPRMQRQFAAWCFIGLEVLIALTGNYTYFNLLSIALCLFLFDDRVVGGITRSLGFAGSPAAEPVSFGDSCDLELTDLPPVPDPIPEPCRAERVGSRVLAAVLIWLSIGHTLQTLGVAPPSIFREPARYTAALQIVNSYGLFAVMTTMRPEIIVEGSNDGQVWRAYEFKYKPGDVNRAPAWVAPLQPRLDWQMWFAALRNYQANPWFVNFALQLLRGSPDVDALLERNPFPDAPPRYVRANVYEYRFSRSGESRNPFNNAGSETGSWWHREFKGEYLPAVGLRGAEGDAAAPTGQAPANPSATPSARPPSGSGSRP